jgi:hypothetical protein
MSKKLKKKWKIYIKSLLKQIKNLIEKKENIKKDIENFLK